MEKGQSPFYLSQPVPVELFIGRQDQLDWIIRQGISQIEHGKPISIFVQGEYGIGKSSIARSECIRRFRVTSSDSINVSLIDDRAKLLKRIAELEQLVEVLRCGDLIRFNDGELSDERAEAFRDHLARCSECQTGFTELEELDAHIAELRRTL